MKPDAPTPPSSATCPCRKSGWGTEALLAAGFVVGCLVGRTRLAKASLLMLAGGVAWELLRPKHQAHSIPDDAPSEAPPMSEAPPIITDTTAEEPVHHMPLAPLADAFTNFEPVFAEPASADSVPPSETSAQSPEPMQAQAEQAPEVIVQPQEPVVTYVTPDSERVDMPKFSHSEAVTVPIQLDQAASAAWLLGLEPMPLVEDEPAWRRPLLAGIQSAFETVPASEATIPDEIEINQTSVSDLAPATPPTRGLLGKLFDAPANLPVIKPKTEPLITSASIVAKAEPQAMNEPTAKPASESWLTTELQESRRRMPALKPMQIDAAAHAASLATSSPVRREPAIAGAGASAGEKKKSWLGLWK